MNTSELLAREKHEEQVLKTFYDDCRKVFKKWCSLNEKIAIARQLFLAYPIQDRAAIAWHYVGWQGRYKPDLDLIYAVMREGSYPDVSDWEPYEEAWKLAAQKRTIPEIPKTLHVTIDVYLTGLLQYINEMHELWIEYSQDEESTSEDCNYVHTKEDRLHAILRNMSVPTRWNHKKEVIEFAFDCSILEYFGIEGETPPMEWENYRVS